MTLKFSSNVMPNEVATHLCTYLFISHITGAFSMDQLRSVVGMSKPCYDINLVKREDHCYAYSCAPMQLLRGILGVLGKENSLFPEGPVIKCFVLL